ncbi:MAG: hypothetical protein GY768_10915 [Planctomycetaceae bacterium]|nr:hypothetical protein [Planctomycetaceae bacterium]
MFENRKMILDPAWNVQTHDLSRRTVSLDALRQPFILHFSGAAKPWWGESTYSPYWWKYARMTTQYERLLRDFVSAGFTQARAKQGKVRESNLSFRTRWVRRLHDFAEELKTYGSRFQ